MSRSSETRTSRLIHSLVNPIATFLALKVGADLGGVRVLEVTGRRSGRVQTTPINPLILDDRVYLVGIYGESDWVRNVRASGRATLRGKVSRRDLVLEELEVGDRAAILQAYLKKWDSQVKGFLGVDRTASDDELATLSPRIPIFREVPHFDGATTGAAER